MGSGSSKLGGQYAKLKHEDFTDKEYLFGNVRKVSNKYFVPEKQVINNDEVVIFTNNVKVIKGNVVLVTGDNKAVYLKDYAAAQTDYGMQFAVKLKRQYFKEYTFKNTIDENFYFEKDYKFDDFLKMAKKQEKVRRRVRLRSVDIYDRDMYLHNSNTRLA